MDQNGIVGELSSLFSGKVGFDARTTPLSARLRQDLGLDSLALMTLVVEVENHFRICLDPTEEQNVQTLGDLVNVIARALESEAAADASEAAR